MPANSSTLVVCSTVTRISTAAATAPNARNTPASWNSEKAEPGFSVSRKRRMPGTRTIGPSSSAARAHHLVI